MDIVTQRLIAISHKILAELRRIGDTLDILHADSEQQREAVNAAQERNSQQKEVKPVWLDDILAKYDKTEGKRTTNDDRQHRVQNSIRWATWCAFLAAAFYGAVAYRQWREMIIATEATQQAVEETRRNRQQSERSLSATIEQFRLDQRAWLGVDNIVGEAKIGEVFSITVYLKNTGRTPAKQVLFFTAGKPVPKGDRLAITYDQVPTYEYSRGMIPPNSVHGVSPPTPIAAMDERTLNMIKKRDVVLYVYGKGTYRDVFGCGHWLTYCYYLAGDAKNWTDCGQYNDTGNDKCNSSEIPKP